MRKVHFQGKPFASFPLTFSKFPSYLSIIPTVSPLKRGTRARCVLVQEIADDEEVVRVIKVVDTVRRWNRKEAEKKKRKTKKKKKKKK